MLPGRRVGSSRKSARFGPHACFGRIRAWGSANGQTYCPAVRVLPEPTCRTTGSLPSGDVQVMALFDPANSMLAPLPKATITVLFEPTMSSHLQAPVRVSVLLLPRMWAPPAAVF
jgi:hypothetical protein